jgi:di/tricarboxylate transporter
MSSVDRLGWESPFHNDADLMCPCPIKNPRRLEDAQEGGNGGETWQIVYMCIVLLYMFVALLSDRVGADAVMITALTLCMAAEIVTIDEGLAGFANEGLLTVMVLFVVAEGISVTGALDWYMNKLLGSPTTTAGAQLRLMVPIAAVSAFLNNTPVVAVMIPIVQQWSKKIRQNPQQLLIPLSFASILGGTCTLIGTSTNLVVVGLLNDRFPNDDTVSIGLFDLSIYGVPVAIAGTAYILLLSPFLLPGGKRRSSASDGVVPLDGNEILLGARLTQWSPAAGRSVKRSGLRDTGGVFLVSVYRAATGNVHRAVGQEFVLNVGDILYFTGLVEGFGEFCEEHGLEVVTNEVEDTMSATPPTVLEHDEHSNDTIQGEATNHSVHFEGETVGAASTDVPKLVENEPLAAVAENDCEDADDVPCEVGITKKSLMKADEAERMRSINRMTGESISLRCAFRPHSTWPNACPSMLFVCRHDPGNTT